MKVSEVKNGGHFRGKTLVAEKVPERWIDKIIFAPGLTNTAKIQILQTRAVFPNSFTYEQLMVRFQISLRSAHRRREKMEQLGIVKKVAEVPVAKFEWSEDWR